MKCINLKNKFGKLYRVKYEESYRAEHKYGGDPWLMIILCKYGHIFPWGGKQLAASVDGHSRIANNIKRLKCCTVVQEGDFGELTATFHIDDMKYVKKIMHPIRKKVITEEQRKILSERLRRAREIKDNGSTN